MNISFLILVGFKGVAKTAIRTSNVFEVREEKEKKKHF